MQKKIIDKYFEKAVVTAYNTKKSYKGNINKFFTFLEENPETYIDKSKRIEDYEDDLSRFYLHLVKTGCNSIRTVMNPIKQFLCIMDKRMKQSDFWDTLNIRTRGASSVSKDFIPNANDIKTVLMHGKEVSRAMFLIQSSVGCRIGELIALYPEDIDTSSKPTKLLIRRSYDSTQQSKVKLLTKTRKQRTCFISDEATEAYHAWMKIRDEYLKSTIKRSRYAKDPNDKRVFPMSDENARTIWEIMVKKSGLWEKDSTTNRLTLHPHCLRKFFRSYFGNSDLAQHLMGQATGMDKFYRNMKPEDLAQKYLKYMKNVTIFESAPDLSGIHEELQQKDERIKELEQKIAEINRKLDEGVNVYLFNELQKIKKGK